MNGARYNLSDLNGVFMFQQFKERNGHPKNKNLPTLYKVQMKMSIHVLA